MYSTNSNRFRLRTTVPLQPVPLATCVVQHIYPKCGIYARNVNSNTADWARKWRVRITDQHYCGEDQGVDDGVTRASPATDSPPDIIPAGFSELASPLKVSRTFRLLPPPPCLVPSLLVWPDRGGKST